MTRISCAHTVGMAENSGIKCCVNDMQPDYIVIDEKIRLRKYDGIFDFAFQWYQDEETLCLVDGENVPYTMERIQEMYTYLDEHGELYFIEYLENDRFIPIGDVTFWQQDMPIVIGNKNYRRQGIGRKVVAALADRGRMLGYDFLYVNEIYEYNIGSRRCFESVGFEAYEKTEKGSRYRLRIN